MTVLEKLLVPAVSHRVIELGYDELTGAVYRPDDLIGLTPVERPISIDELRDGIASGRVTETFACGTAAVITPIVGFDSPEHGAQVVGDGEPGPRTRELRAHLLDIQFGRAEDRHGWLRRVV